MRRSSIMPATLAALAVLGTLACSAVPLNAQEPPVFTRADTLRGTHGPERAWWDVTFYDLHVRVNPADSTIAGWNAISYRVVQPAAGMQIDLQEPLVVDSVVQDGERLSVRREGNALFVALSAPQPMGGVKTVTVHYHGTPRAAVNPPWDGGFIWRRDPAGAPWVATANQGLGASVWWPLKDWGGDEPDSQRVAITVPEPMVNVSNGRLRSARPNGDGTTTWEWFAGSPINNYGIAVNAGDYAHWTEFYQGEAGILTLDFWPLAVNEAVAREHWQQTRPMLACFEDWFGPYPWYGDGFKLIETPHLGMEHQSAVAYGNGYQNGYRGRDLSGTGRGLTWDFIIIHEAAHEWFANNISMRDAADMWIHESFANYAENLYVECQTGSAAAGAEYVIGTRASIRNDRPVQGIHGVNYEGSGDMYYKGGNMLHAIRQIIDDDARWRSILRGLNADLGRTTVSGAEVEAYISSRAGVELSKVFDQYLRTTDVPVLEWRREGGTLRHRWTNTVEGFDMPVRVRTSPGAPYEWIRPTTSWQRSQLPASGGDLEVDPNFYVTARHAG
ncbi:MAG: M1 family metallopeptidase [Gemmatimonadota bacterium]